MRGNTPLTWRNRGLTGTERLRRRDRARISALLGGVIDQSRQPDLYRILGAPDTVEGRFELQVLHLTLLLDRLETEGGWAARLGQDLFDRFLGDLDGAMREMGVGDLAMPRRMKALGALFYARQKDYLDGLACLPDSAPLQTTLERSLGEGGSLQAARLADYVGSVRGRLAEQTLDQILEHGPVWPHP